MKNITTSGGSTGEGGDRPLDWGQKKFIARHKNKHICKSPFAYQNVLKLTYSNLEFQTFTGEDPRIPSSRGGKGRKGGEEREGKGRGRREGRDREGREGRQGTWEGRREGGEEWGWGGGEGARPAPAS